VKINPGGKGDKENLLTQNKTMVKVSTSKASKNNKIWFLFIIITQKTAIRLNHAQEEILPKLARQPLR